MFYVYVSLSRTIVYIYICLFVLLKVGDWPHVWCWCYLFYNVPTINKIILLVLLLLSSLWFITIHLRPIPHDISRPLYTKISLKFAYPKIPSQPPRGQWAWCLAVFLFRKQSWWRHQMETFSALLAICAGNSPVPDEIPAHRPVTRSFDVFFDLRPNKPLSKQRWGLWLETSSCPQWRHHNGITACVCWDMCVPTHPLAMHVNKTNLWEVNTLHRHLPLQSFPRRDQLVNIDVNIQYKISPALSRGIVTCDDASFQYLVKLLRKYLHSEMNCSSSDHYQIEHCSWLWKRKYGISNSKEIHVKYAYFIR